MEQNEIQALALNVKRFRSEQDWTQQELAKKTGLSLSSVKTIETGKAANPSVNTIGKLSRAFNRSFGDLLSEPKSLERIRFRAKSSLSKLSRLNVVDLCARWLEDYCFVEELLGVVSSFDPRLRSDVSGDDVKSFAEDVRLRLNISPNVPIYDVADVLRKCDVKLWYCPRRPSNDVFGLAINESPQATGVVVFSDGDVSVEQIIFTTIHEFAHLLLHERSFSPEATKENEEEERQADAFASHFLMPKELFRRQWNDTIGDRLVERVLRVKRFFKVGYLTVLSRLVEEEFFDSNVYIRFPIEYRKFAGKNLREHKEPKRLTRFDAPRDGFQRLVCEAALKGEISVGRAAEMLNVPTLEAYDLINHAGGKL